MAFAQPYQKNRTGAPCHPCLILRRDSFHPTKPARGVITRQMAEINRALINLKKQA